MLERCGVKLQYYIGVDGGGTKTAIAAASIDATQIFFEETGSASWREYGIETVIETIERTIATFPFETEDSIVGMAMGLPCYGESVPGDHALEKALHNAFPDIELYITTDAELGLAGSLGLLPGINVVAGTGSVAFGKDGDGTVARSGGWSECFGDEGSCYWMGRRLMELFSKQSDGRCARDALHEIVCRELGLVNDFDFIDLMHNEYMPKRARVASLQLLAKQAAQAGSESALALYAEAAQELCLLVRAVRDHLAFGDKPFLVSYSGGLFRSGGLVLPQFAKGIAELGGELMSPQFEPVEGALLLAFSKFHPDGLLQLCQRLKANK